MKVRVGINGYGTIGKRVASAVAAQDDMEVIGVTKTRPSYEAHLACAEGYPLYVAKPDQVAAFEKEGIKVEGTLEDLVGKVDIMVDATPGGVGEAYRELYERAGIKAIFQGGEDHGIAGVSFNAYANYKESWGAKFSRVVSCNTTGLVRTLYPLDKEIGVERVSATIVRRGADPSDNKGSALNSLEPSLKLPTHHGPDVQTIMPWINITTMAVKSPTTLMHLHCVIADLKKEVKESDVLAAWDDVSRVRLVSGKRGLKGTANIMELAKDLDRPRGDFMEIAVWQDGIKVVGKTLYYYQAVHQESDVVPENIDCIRSMMKMEPDASRSIKKTDTSLGIGE
ncbi:MAG: type II glyceraldehyde-3-phosphate dehydrogenase [Methanomassiliicoccaceae archaeon]|jgi:glyceraldehyde-3-phosphate dehydrogenase (NAD(P))|nr:type II glyceraldehyde-3-phosphate dehydrogenase [Euryarchaeota archaeon]HOB37791.1 type II glyceraldehyde-3-phosphate dehydrogenase [Methanomassiliicoccaceae archaeon]HOQ26203.1 type II glyceraldehyde-3-phosphate dehydrogenase [Methanomassiliicoccaceae archaeon]HQA20476.1 type II glyceraldehyde-3-phosphate dehydrogenase [Methanomassiliicoccaceae archaeon]